MIWDCDAPLPDRPVLWDEADGWHHGAELERRIAALASGLLRGTLLFLYCRNNLATVLVYLAAVRAGCAVALVDPDRPVAELSALQERYQPETLAGGGGKMPSGYRDVMLGGVHLLRRSTPVAPVHPDLCLLLATSGSTGSPKFVRLSRAAVTANAAAIAEVLELGPAERPLCHLALHYSYGLSVLNSHLAAGAAVVLTEHGLTGRAAWDLCRAQACTSLAGVPAHYELMRRLDDKALALPALRTLTQAGGKLAPQTALLFHRRMASRDGRLFVMYGQTEAAPRMATLPPDRLPEKPGSVGRALPGGHFEICRDDGITAAPDETGEIVYHGPNVMMGYAQERSDLAQGDQMGQRLATGDIGYLDADGDLFITGRQSRFAKLFGLRISLDDVEARLSPTLGQVAAIEHDGKVVVHCCHDVAPAAFHAALRGLGLPAAGFALRHGNILPVTASGKIDYRRLADAT